MYGATNMSRYESSGRKATTVLSLGLSLVLTGLASAAEREWVAFDNSPAGTPPTVQLIPESGSAEKSVFEIEIHGLWIENRMIPGTNEVMQVVSLPGDGALATTELGQPQLPGIGLALACTSYSLPSHTPDNDGGVFSQQVTLENIRVFPAQPQDDEDIAGDNDNGQFYFDMEFYQSTTTPFPAQSARMVTGFHFNRGIPTVGYALTCMQAVPASSQLIVNTKFEYTVTFSGNLAEAVSLPPRAAASFDLTYDNAPMWWQLQLVTLNMDATKGDYLIVTPSKYISELMPLIAQKAERGLHVTIVTSESLGEGFDHHDVKSAISDWYDGCSNVFEVYVLLVGDVDEMPMHVDPVNELPSDHYYVCLEDELFPSCELGRFSVDSEEDLEAQITKTMNYSENPLMISGHYERSLLAAHKQASKNYVECIEEIEAASYWGYSPSFRMYSGREADSLVSNVVTDINDTHYGLVMYRGHGWKLKWGDNWNIYNEELWDTDVAGMTNGRYTPIVVAVACGNNAIDMEDDSIGETWMEGSENGAVAHIGSIRSSKTTPNHEFAKAFQNYYWSGYNLCISEMMQDAWLTARMNVSNQSNAEKNIYMSQLLGDPELRPWQQSPLQIVLLDLPHFSASNAVYTFELDLENAIDPTDVILVATVDGFLHATGRFDENGQVSLSMNLEADSAIVVRAHTELANAADGRYEAVVETNDCPSDLNGDGDVNVDDLLAVIAGWSTDAADINGDGTTDVDDLLVVLSEFGLCD
jgi:hypothetical protein